MSPVNFMPAMLFPARLIPDTSYFSHVQNKATKSQLSFAYGAGATTFTRDTMGRVTSTTKAGESVSRAYDNLGRVTSYTAADGNTVGYAYDTAGNLASITYPDNTQVTYGYDADGFLTRVTDWDGRITEITRDLLLISYQALYLRLS